MRTTVEIQNLKCGGCSKTITSKLAGLESVSNVFVDVENSTVSFDHFTDVNYDDVKNMLAKLGYPLVDEKNNFGRKTKSYISCAIGKMGN